jgi:putative adhesin
MSRFRTYAVAIVLPAALTASAACDIAMADHRQKETSEWRKTYELQPGGRVEIGNVNGKVEILPGQGNTVEVVALKTGTGVSQDAAKEALGRIEILEDISPGSIKIETKTRRDSGSLFGGGGLRVDYTVRVPQNAEVRASTLNGGVAVTGLNGKVYAEATNGGVKARDVTGALQATTTNGGIDVDLARLSEAGVKLECTNGGIILRLPADAKASISARVMNGGIETNGLMLDSGVEPSKRRLDARLNGGGARVDLEGTNGGIRISSR